MAVGNVVGSNIFNILAVLGGSAVVAGNGLPVAGAALSVDIPIMVIVALLCLPIFVSGRVIDRWEGGFFLAAYGLYVGLLVTLADGQPSAAEAGTRLIGLLLPLAVVWGVWQISRSKPPRSS
jgi:cation:H+ antiporter